MREPIITSIIKWLQLPAGSSGLDAGCGIGHQSFELANAIGMNGHVTGLDILPESISYATELASKKGLSNTTFQTGSVQKLPFKNDSFDWGWSSDCIGQLPGDSYPAVKELIRVVKPGGRIIILAWTSQMLLPGYATLESKLNATSSGYAPATKGMEPGHHFLRLPSVFRQAELKNIKAKTFNCDFFAPLTGEIRDAIQALIEMRWLDPKSELTAADWKTFKAITNPDSSDYILIRPDYFMYYTYTLFQGIKPIKEPPTSDSRTQL